MKKSTLVEKIEYLFPDTDFEFQVVIISIAGWEHIEEWNHIDLQPDKKELAALDDNTDFLLWLCKRRSNAIDREIGQAINDKIPLEEQIGIFRQEIRTLLIALNQASSEKLTRFNEIAEAEIAKGRIKKDALKE